MVRFSFPIRVKVMLTVLLLIMVVMSLNTSTMVNLFRKDKTTYIRDLTAVMAVHLAEESDALLRSYVANMRAYGDVIYDSDMDAATKQTVIQNLFRNYQDIVVIAARRGDSDLITAFDTNALTRLDVSRSDLLAYRDEHPLPTRLTRDIDVTMEHIKNGVGLVRLIVEIPPTETSESYTIAASIHPAKLLYVGRRARGFTAAIMDQQGRRVFEEITQTATTPSWFSDLINNSTTSIGSALEFDENGVPMIGAVASFADGALFATIRIPSSVVYFTARELLANLMIAALLLFALAAAASLVFARRLSKPLEHLADMAKKVGQGEFDINVDVNSGDEIGTLSNSFNRMTGELREREEKLAGANAALIQSEKLAAFGQIGAGIAHEVKNPLAGILGYTQLALRKVDEDSPLKKNLNIIEKETRRCTDIISNLLQFARHEKAEAGPVQINSVVDAAIQIVDHQLGVNNVKITKELGADLPTIKANSNQLQQAIMNFAINAQQAMGDEGGNLVVRTHLRADSAVVIEIEDDGPGIPEDIRAKVFDPFFTTKPAGQGTGLGLSVTYGIIKDHGGDIQIESVEHGGTRFVVSLPIQVAKVA